MASRLLAVSKQSLVALSLFAGGTYVGDETNGYRQCYSIHYLASLYNQVVPNFSLQQNRKILSRSLRVFRAGSQVVWDYRLHFKGTERDDPDYSLKLQSLNERIAQRLFDVCYQNGGIYTKFGQQIATLNHGIVPMEYTETLAQLQDQAKPVSFEEVTQTIEAEMGRPWQQSFKELGQTPIACASLAQVHHAVDHQGRDLAVKVQYQHLESQMKADIQVIKWAFQLIEYYFPDVQIQWLFPEFKSSLLSEVR